MKAADIRELTPDELTKHLDDAQRELLNLRIQNRTGQLENTDRLRKVRRQIARLKTECTARKRA